MTTTPTPDPATTALDEAIARLDDDTIEFEFGKISRSLRETKSDLRLVLDALREARKDSERIEWLADRSPFVEQDMHYRHVRSKWFYFASNIRTAIDAARSGEEKGGA